MKGLELPPKCEFDLDLDGYLRYHDLAGDDVPRDKDECQRRCCDDPTCNMWQWSDDPSEGSHCIRGDSDNWDGTGGRYWQGAKRKIGGVQPAQKQYYSCNAPGQHGTCQPVKGRNGEFPSFQACIESSCNEPPPEDRYDCIKATGRCAKRSNHTGSFSNEFSCTIGCDKIPPTPPAHGPTPDGSATPKKGHAALWWGLLVPLVGVGFVCFFMAGRRTVRPASVQSTLDDALENSMSDPFIGGSE